jgi:hypothetical protein
MSDRLWEIATYAADAAESIESALRAANRINSATPDDDAPAWPALNETIVNLEKIRASLATAIPAEMTEGIKHEQAEYDDDEARADAASY